MLLKICQPPLVVGEPTSGLPERHINKARRRENAGHTVGQMPNIALDTETAWAIPSLGHIPSHSLGKVIVLKVSNRLREETGTN